MEPIKTIHSKLIEIIPDDANALYSCEAYSVLFKQSFGQIWIIQSIHEYHLYEILYQYAVTKKYIILF